MNEVPGSIPASAGEPSFPQHQTSPATVYPRECGGTSPVRGCMRLYLGLSPRVRGNRRGNAGHGHRPRSIPASAGEPRLSHGDARQRRVYPRECGGTISSGAVNSCFPGLSPRVRGNRSDDAAGAAGHRSIPASAGEPGYEEVLRGVWGVYPRECGGTMASSGFSVSLSGLSPRVRGNRACAREHVPIPGSIPASAGEPRCWNRQASAPGVYPASAGEPDTSASMFGPTWVYPRECGGTRSSPVKRS